MTVEEVIEACIYSLVLISLTSGNCFLIAALQVQAVILTAASVLVAQNRLQRVAVAKQFVEQDPGWLQGQAPDVAVRFQRKGHGQVNSHTKASTLSLVPERGNMAIGSECIALSPS